MAINPISFPQYQINSTVDPSMWSQLGNLGKVYETARTDADKKRLLSQLGPDAAANANIMATSGYQDLASMGLNLQGQLRGETRQDARNVVLDQQAKDAAARAERGVVVQENQDRRLQGTYDEDSPEARAKKARAAGIEPTSPQGKEYILTGKFPPPREPTFSEAVDLRKQQAVANGLTEGSPAYQSYVLTGKMPREDAQALSATDKKIIKETDDNIITHQAVIDSLVRAKKLSPDAFTGPTAGVRGYAGSFLGESSSTGKAGIATENLRNEVLANALSQLKSIFGAAPTEGERKILLELQGSVDKTDRVRQDIYDRALGMVKNRMAEEQKRASELRGGTFYKPGGGVTAPKAGPVDPLNLRGG